MGIFFRSMLLGTLMMPVFEGSSQAGLVSLDDSPSCAFMRGPQAVDSAVEGPSRAWEGVSLTALEQNRVLGLANQATDVELDHGVGLDERAVSGIQQARPLRSISELAALPFVGPAALLKLKAHAHQWRPPVESQRFSDDLESALIDYYADHAADISDAGGTGLQQAMGQISATAMRSLHNWELERRGYDPERVVAYLHPDPVSPESQLAWLGAYDQISGELVHIGAVELLDTGFGQPACQL